MYLLILLSSPLIGVVELIANSWLGQNLECLTIVRLRLNCLLLLSICKTLHFLLRTRYHKVFMNNWSQSSLECVAVSSPEPVLGGAPDQADQPAVLAAGAGHEASGCHQAHGAGWRLTRGPGTRNDKILIWLSDYQSNVNIQCQILTFLLESVWFQ